MKRMLLGATALAMGAGFAGPAFADFTLNILHINDFHSRFESITGIGLELQRRGRDGKGECFGGVARLKTAIDAERAASEAAGDTVGPAVGRRQLPGLALLHDLQVQGRHRLHEPDGLRRRRHRQPRVRRRPRGVPQVHRQRRLPDRRRQLRRLALRPPARQDQGLLRPRRRRREDRHHRRDHRGHARDRLARR